MDNLEQKNAPRTAYVGNPEEFGKFNYYISKTSICIQQIGFIAMSREAYENASHEDYIGCVDDLEELIREHAIDQIYIMQNDEDDLRVTQRYVDLCIDMGVTVRLVVDFYKRRGADSYVSSVGTYPVITYHTVSLNTNEQLIKRMVDVFGGLVGILVFSPIMLIVAIAVKIDSPGPILFKQERAGQNGRKFKMYKFRSMYQDAEKRKQELMDQNEMNGELMFKMKEDPRITRVGKVIRKLSIDELPQFFNVLGGSMSLVGTRPPTMDEVEKYQKNHWRRISIKPGITGMWQVNGRSSIQDFNDVVELDVEYIDNWSLWLDLKIMVKTVFVVLGRSEAY
jgi:exopolysaccharide biosynthesis polyprenyl glycosylphosphotransferase